MPLVVIQDTDTGRFVAPTGWTRKIPEALCFDQVLRAWEEIAERRLSNVQIMLIAEGGREIARAL